MAPRAPSLESLLSQFRRGNGLFILGAGASAGVTPFGDAFMTTPGLNYVSEAGSFPVSIPAQSELNRRIIGMTTRRLSSGLAFGRWIREVDDFPYFEILQRLPDYYARLALKHALAKPLFLGRRADNYLVFRFFEPSFILNYNLDGLASAQLRGLHRVVDVHRTVAPGYGSPEVAQLMDLLREHDLQAPPDDILMCIPETREDVLLRNRLRLLDGLRPDFIAIVGYSFGRNGDSFDDHISLSRLGRVFSGYAGNIFVIDPWPENVREMVAACIRSNSVFGVPQYWNIVAHAFLKAMTGRSAGRSLNYLCHEALDRFGSGVAFPRAM